MSAVVAISSEHGLVEYFVTDGAINKERFLRFIDMMKDKVGIRKDVVIFMDNLSVHHSNVVKEKIAILGWRLLFNAAYSSEIHCIEVVFASVKRTYRTKILSQIRNLNHTQHRKIIEESIESVPKDQIGRTIDKFVVMWRKMLDYAEE